MPEAARDDVEVLARASEYLKSLTTGLRMLALDPESASPGRPTTLATWWREAAPICRTVLPRGVSIEAGDFENVAPVAISPHAMTQIVFNLVQNAGDALRDRHDGRVWLSARGASVVEHDAALHEPAVWITDATSDESRVRAFLLGGERRWVVHVGERAAAHARVVVVAEPKVGQISDAIAQLWKSMGGEV